MLMCDVDASHMIQVAVKLYHSLGSLIIITKDLTNIDSFWKNLVYEALNTEDNTAKASSESSVYW